MTEEIGQKLRAIYQCSNCHSTDIKQAVWQEINTDTIDASSAPVAGLMFCERCEEIRGDGEIRYIEEVIKI